MSRAAAPIAGQDSMPPFPSLSRGEILGMMRDERDATPVIKEWCSISRILVSMFDVLGEDDNQRIIGNISDTLFLNMIEFLKMVAYAKAPESSFDPPQNPRDFLENPGCAYHAFPHIEPELYDLDTDLPEQDESCLDVVDISTPLPDNKCPENRAVSA